MTAEIAEDLAESAEKIRGDALYPRLCQGAPNGTGIGVGARGGMARIARADVRLYQFAPPDKSRPVIVLTRDSALAYRSTATVAPSTIRGVPSEIVLTEENGMKAVCAVNLHHAVTVSQRRLGKRVAQLNSSRLRDICAALAFSLGCDNGR